MTTNNYQISVYAPGFTAMDRVGENPAYAVLGRQMSMVGSASNYSNILDLYNQKLKFGQNDLKGLIDSNYATKTEKNLEIPTLKLQDTEKKTQRLSLSNIIASCCKN